MIVDTEKLNPTLQQYDAWSDQKRGQHPAKANAAGRSA